MSPPATPTATSTATPTAVPSATTTAAPITIRLAEPDDAEALAALVAQFESESLADPDDPAAAAPFRATVTPEAFRERIADEHFHHHVAAIEDGESSDRSIAGFVAVRDHGHLYHLFVDRDAHRQGLARRLWETARSAAENAGNPGRFTVSSTLYALPVYERFGFVPTQAAIEQDGIVFVPMVLTPDTEPRHRTADELEAALPTILAAPADEGTVEMIVRRPGLRQRERVEEGRLEPAVGLVGDNWSKRGSSKTADGAAHPEMQLNLMSSRVIEAVAGPRARWPLAGDQLFVDLDLGPDNLPVGTRLAVGDDAVIEVSPMPHLGCKKFVHRFGVEAMKFINSGRGKALRLRGINAVVIEPGTVRTGDRIRQLAST